MIKGPSIFSRNNYKDFKRHRFWNNSVQFIKVNVFNLIKTLADQVGFVDAIVFNSLDPAKDERPLLTFLITNDTLGLIFIMASQFSISSIKPFFVFNVGYSLFLDVGDITGIIGP